MTNKTTEALKLAEKTLRDIIRVYKFETGTPVTALAAIREALAEPVKQEPVAWRVHPFGYGVGHEGAYAMTMRLEQVEAWNRKGWIVEPLYAAPVSAEAIRAEERQRCIEAIRKAHHKELCDVWDCIEVIKELE